MNNIVLNLFSPQEADKIILTVLEQKKAYMSTPFQEGELNDDLINFVQTIFMRMDRVIDAYTKYVVKLDSDIHISSFHVQQNPYVGDLIEDFQDLLVEVRTRVIEATHAAARVKNVLNLLGFTQLRNFQEGDGLPVRGNISTSSSVEGEETVPGV